MALTERTKKGKALTEAELDNNFLCHYPIGSLYLAASPAIDSPGVMIGYGSWSKFAKGRALISSDIEQPGLGDGSGTMTNTHFSPGLGDGSGNNPRRKLPDYPYGSPSHKVKTSELPAHSHTWERYYGNGALRFSGNYSGFNFETAGTDVYRITGGQGEIQFTNSPTTINDNLSQAVGHPHNNLQPYIVVNIWKRDS